jgi:hypothetical protein
VLRYNGFQLARCSSGTSSRCGCPCIAAKTIRHDHCAIDPDKEEDQQHLGIFVPRTNTDLNAASVPHPAAFWRHRACAIFTQRQANRSGDAAWAAGAGLWCRPSGSNADAAPPTPAWRGSFGRPCRSASSHRRPAAAPHSCRRHPRATAPLPPLASYLNNWIRVHVSLTTRGGAIVGTVEPSRPHECRPMQL